MPTEDELKKFDEQRIAQEKAVAEQVAKIEAEKKAAAETRAKEVAESDFLTKARTLREEQDKLIDERKKFEAEKTEFARLTKEAETAGQSLAGDAVSKEPTKEEAVTATAKKTLAGTGFEDRI